jgi:aminoglycoside/choline kinase family phosphotransferase
MIKNDELFFIDFQGGRIGPIQYDLASLLIDPYVSIPLFMQNRLLDFCKDHLRSFVPFSTDKLLKGYRYCAIARNLQILGAFSFLSRVKKKKEFQEFIPCALHTLKINIDDFFPPEKFPLLKSIVKKSMTLLLENEEAFKTKK